MKRVPLIFALCCVLLGAGCADPVEQRSTEEVGAQLERGVTGQGTLGPPNRLPDDQAAEHGVPQNHP